MDPLILPGFSHRLRTTIHTVDVVISDNSFSTVFGAWLLGPAAEDSFGEAAHGPGGDENFRFRSGTGTSRLAKR